MSLPYQKRFKGCIKQFDQNCKYYYSERDLFYQTSTNAVKRMAEYLELNPALAAKETIDELNTVYVFVENQKFIDFLDELKVFYTVDNHEQIADDTELIQLYLPVSVIIAIKILMEKKYGKILCSEYRFASEIHSSMPAHKRRKIKPIPPLFIFSLKENEMIYARWPDNQLPSKLESCPESLKVISCEDNFLLVHKAELHRWLQKTTKGKNYLEESNDTLFLQEKGLDYSVTECKRSHEDIWRLPFGLPELDLMLYNRDGQLL